ncbi:tyrosine-type recombinase/integrase [Pseudomonas cannabina]|uniref:Phage integrase n=2 Tax=Pseudomonas cannabina TaxID=86840 RepID=A0A3M3QJS1_PSECA|nr:MULTISPECIES: tyrosine-type recombinase/integrase [Pseudomonas syringae group]KPB74936.1 putative phage integrase [Pseudomonas syringae pv. maculicola]KPW19825.1 putative phage integrase [Pseudomonas cannabina pv. alisalensis]MBM0140492.1 tyrosine-type recombinase/integrase [Pseudomonas cannabina pv. alisalensis]QQN23034.1 tyrosine-type recombinase/integrase [Pseudomonas cannabina pv. alisalensis]RMN78290.1 putative phage integrase [Pseudomonas cannabina pv. alisalensis]
MKRSEIKRRPLSDTTLAGLEPELKEYRELDANGLYFRVKPDGQKSWQLRYKKTDGKWSWLGLGGYPEVSGAAARAKAADLRADTAEGRNPMVTKQARKAAEAQAANDTFETLAREWHASRIGGWDAGTAKRIMGALERHVFPTFGQRRYTGILSMEWMELLRGLEQQGILEQMSRVRAYCKDVYDLARVTGRAVNNPLEGIHKFLSSGKAENYAHVSAEELPALLRAIQSYPHAKDVQLGLRLLTLLAVRPSELREAQWSEFDLEKKLWTIPVERKGRKKGREHLVPLCRQAIELLEELRPITGAYPLLFPGRSDRTKPRSDTVFLMALRRIGYEGRQTGHGFRHIASTTLNEHGFPADHIEAQLSHKPQGVRGVYNKAQYLAQRTTMMQWYADHLDGLTGDVIIQGDFGRRA